MTLIIGPYLVTTDEITNINNLNLSLDVNGQKNADWQYK